MKFPDIPFLDFYPQGSREETCFVRILYTKVPRMLLISGGSKFRKNALERKKKKLQTRGPEGSAVLSPRPCLICDTCPRSCEYDQSARW